MLTRIIHGGRNEVAQGYAGTAQPTLVGRTRLVPDVKRQKRPKLRQCFRLLVPAYRSMNNPG